MQFLQNFYATVGEGNRIYNLNAFQQLHVRYEGFVLVKMILGSNNIT